KRDSTRRKHHFPFPSEANANPNPNLNPCSDSSSPFRSVVRSRASPTFPSSSRRSCLASPRLAMRSSSAAAQPAPAAAAAMYGSYAAAPASSGGYAKIPTYPPPPSAYPAPVAAQPVAQGAVVHDPTAPPSPIAKAAELVTRFREQGQALIAARRPWGEVFRAPAFSKPPSVGEAVARARRNVAYFRANYALSVLAVVAASLLWHPGTLFALLALCAAWFFLYFARPASSAGQPLRLFGMEFEDGTVLAALTGVTVIALLFTNVGWNVIGSVMIGAALVGAHATLRSTDDLFLTEQEAAGDGLVAAGMSAAGPILPTYVRIG
ncbi:PRA1 family protein F3-like, partial [Oryza brachyantha]|uniref:PRA1 family protein F3-like n=1 Tax=Oryza brachyantha TaxID=4533 RepID=UPI001AD9667F